MARLVPMFPPETMWKLLLKFPVPVILRTVRVTVFTALVGMPLVTLSQRPPGTMSARIGVRGPRLLNVTIRLLLQIMAEGTLRPVTP